MTDLRRRSQEIGTRPALVLVDLSVGFTDPSSPLGCACDAIMTVNMALLAAFRSHSLPVFFTSVCYRSSRQATVFRNRLPALDILSPDSPWVSIDSRVQPRHSEPIIEKQYASGFFGTSLARQLAEQYADSLVITGLTTSGCVRATAVDGLQNDYRVFVVKDAVGDRNREAHEANLHDLNAKYADVVTSIEVLAALSGGKKA